MTIKDVPWTKQPAEVPPRVRTGQSTTIDGMPDELILRMVRRMDAEQNRHLHALRMTEAIEKLAEATAENGKYLARIAGALAPLQVPVADEKPEHPSHNDSGLPVPPWVDDPSEHTEDPPGTWDAYRQAVKAAEDAERPAP